MTVASFGLYSVYWFERHWRFRLRTTGEKMWPLARATAQKQTASQVCEISGHGSMAWPMRPHHCQPARAGLTTS